MIEYKQPDVKIMQNKEPYTAMDFINERVINRNMSESLLYEIEEFNRSLQREAEIFGETEYDYVYIDRHDPDIYTDYYYVAVGKVYDKRKKLLKNIFRL